MHEPHLTMLVEELEELHRNVEKGFAVAIILLSLIFIGSCTEVKAEATQAERNYCLQQSYDAQQIAENKLRGIPRDNLLEFLGNIPPDSVPEGYLESNLLTVVEVYEMDFSSAEEAQQKSLVKCLNWHNENSKSDVHL